MTQLFPKKIVKDDGKSSTYRYAVVTAISVLIISIILNVVQLLQLPGISQGHSRSTNDYYNYTF